MVDGHPRFHLEALRWFACLTEVAGADPNDLVVHVVGSESSDALDFLKAQGVAVRPVSRFDPRSPHCNKISGALQLTNERIEGMVVLCDTDIVVLEDPRSLVVPPNAIAGKPVDAPVPPLDVLLAIFAASGPHCAFHGPASMGARPMDPRRQQQRRSLPDPWTATFPSCVGMGALGRLAS